MINMLELYIKLYNAWCDSLLLPSHKKEIIDTGLEYPSLSRDLRR